MNMHNPAHPGEILKELVIEPLGITITNVSEHLNISRKTLSKVLNGRGSITPEMALRLELAFKNPSADHWLRLQNAYDLRNRNVQLKIFISYSTHDLPQVELLQQQLGGTPIEVFVAEHSVQPSEDLGQVISNAISTCDLFVVLWSNNAQYSDWVSQEIGKACTLNKTILPLVLNEGISLPGFINNLKYLPVYKAPEEALNKAREVIINQYNKKLSLLKQAEGKKQSDKEALFLMGAGAFLLWAFSK
ncbi:MAG: HigA family addiction module antitoxin [Sedimenticola sp.]